MASKLEDGPTQALAPEAPVEAQDASVLARRPVLKRLGRFAAVTAPAVTLLLAVEAKPKQAVAGSPLPP